MHCPLCTTEPGADPASGRPERTSATGLSRDSNLTGLVSADRITRPPDRPSGPGDTGHESAAGLVSADRITRPPDRPSGPGDTGHESAAGLVSADGRPFRWCPTCWLVYYTGASYPNREEERLRYETHNNESDDPGYQSFLRRAIDPIGDFLHPGMRALDYGSGPGPAMPVVLGDLGISCTLYDPIYAPEKPEGLFDLITCTETFEHFHRPAESLRHINGLLAAGGLLAVMTEQWTDLSRFGRWYYTRDETHVCFYHHETFNWIADEFGFKVLHDDRRRVVCMQKTNT